MPAEPTSSEQPMCHAKRNSALGGWVANKIGNEEAPFFRRKVGGLSYRFLIGLVSVALLAMVPNGARHALQSMAYKPNDWHASARLTADGQEKSNDQHLLISWTTNATDAISADRIEAEQARLLRQKLSGLVAEAGWPWFPRLEKYTDTKTQADQAELPVCLVAYVSPKLASGPRLANQVIERIRQIASECGIASSSLHLGGDFIEIAAMQQQSWLLLSRLTPLAMLLGMLVVHRATREEKLTAIVMFLGVAAATMSLAVVSYGTMLMGDPNPSNLFSGFPLLVFAIVVASSIYFVKHYGDREHCEEISATASRCFALFWKPTLFGLFCISVGFVSLMADEGIVIQRFGLFLAISIAIGATLMNMLLPASLDYFSSKGIHYGNQSCIPKQYPPFDAIGNWLSQPRSLSQVGLLSVVCLGMSLFVARGISSVECTDPSRSLISVNHLAGSDLAWFTEQFGKSDLVSPSVSLDPTFVNFGLSRSLQLSLLITVIVIACLAIARWNHSLAGLFVLLPTLAAVAVVLGMADMLNQPIGVGLLLSLGGAMGISLMGTLHFLNWYELSYQDSSNHREALEASYKKAAPALFESALVLIASIVPMVLCSITPLYQLASFLVLFTAVGLMMNLTLLPMLLMGSARRCFVSTQDVQDEILVDVPIELSVSAVEPSRVEARPSTIRHPVATPFLAKTESKAEQLAEVLELVSLATRSLATSESPKDLAPENQSLDPTDEPATVRYEPQQTTFVSKEPLSAENELLRRRLRDMRRRA